MQSNLHPKENHCQCAFNWWRFRKCYDRILPILELGFQRKLDSIFDNFQQASSGTSRIYGGTGLGSAIVKQLVEPRW
jgi:hypothetical protein